ncbi:MAG TPA: hypothetical protein VFR58_17180, partial [Flavisolibacter sp.]|nr:hypothetical protein [Flavisolibacter sp.]
MAPLDRAGRFVMAKFDATGEFLWQKQVVFPRSLHFSDGVQDFEGNVLLGANDEDGYTTNNARLIAIDTMGEFKYSRLIDRQGFILWHLLPSNLSSSIFIVGFEPSNRFFNTIYKLQGPARTETSMPYVSFYETRRPCNPIALNFTIDSSDAIYGLPGGRSFSGLTGVPNIRDSAGWYKPWLACKFDSDLNPVWAKQFVLPLGNNGSTGFIGYLNHGLVSGDRVLAGISYLEDLPPL